MRAICFNSLRKRMNIKGRDFNSTKFTLKLAAPPSSVNKQSHRHQTSLFCDTQHVISLLSQSREEWVQGRNPMIGARRKLTKCVSTVCREILPCVSRWSEDKF